MKKILTRALLLMLTLALIIVPLSACNNKTEDDTPVTTSTAAPDSDLEIKIYLLNGTTALGASKLIVDTKAKVSI